MTDPEETEEMGEAEEEEEEEEQGTTGEEKPKTREKKKERKGESGSAPGESDPPWPSDLEKSPTDGSTTESPESVPPIGQVPAILKEKMGSDIPSALQSPSPIDETGEEEGENLGETEGEPGTAETEEAVAEPEAEQEEPEEPGEEERGESPSPTMRGESAGEYSQPPWGGEWTGETYREWPGEGVLRRYPSDYGEDRENIVKDLAQWLSKQLMEGVDGDAWSLDKAFEKAKEVDECEAPKIPLLDQGAGVGSDSELAVKEVTDELVRRAANQARRMRRERRRMREAERLLDPKALKRWLDNKSPCTCVECTCMYIDRRRDYDNPFPDFSATSDKGLEYIGPGTDGPTLRESFLLRVQSASNTYFSLFQDEWRIAMERNDEKSPIKDPSIYTGLCGLAMHLLEAARKRRSAMLLRRALACCHRALPRLSGKRVGFLGGDAGPLALTAALHRLRGEGPIAQHCVNKLRDLLPLVLNLRSGQSNEMLYGRAGYLYAQLYVRSHVAREAVPGGEVRAVCEALLRACSRVSRDEPDTECSLLVRWQGHLYLGAAHGLVGTLFALLAAKQYLTGFELRTMIRPALLFLEDQMMPTGNLPARVDEEVDKQVQWCIGAPGAVHLFVLANKVYGEPRFMETAVRLANVTWKRGLLTKGYGLCHGVSGNAFSFLTLYQATNDAKWLYRACAFAEWCFAYGCYQETPPEAPLSLFEGVLGVVHFFLQLEDPMTAKFPGFAEVP